MVSLALSVTACAGEGGFAEELGVNLEEMVQADSGLYYQDLREGTGVTAAAGMKVTVHYTGWLTDGTQFDTSRHREPFYFDLGRGTVIAGWEEGLSGMKVGGKRKLVIPPDLGYGESGSGSTIPPNATLVFEIELLEVEAR